MRLVHKDHPERGRQAVRWRALALVTALVVLAAVASSSALAAGASRAGAASFCGNSTGVYKDLLNSESAFAPKPGASLTSFMAALKSELLKVKSYEGPLLSTAPAKIKPDLQAVFAFENTIVSDLQKVNFNFLALAAHASSLEAQANKLKPDLAAIEAYYRGTCGFKG